MSAQRIIINVERGCHNLASSIPDGVELVIKDYDVIIDPNSPTQKSDSRGVYEEAVYCRSGNEGLAIKMSGKK